ncbi:Putative defective protein IntQ [Thalassocella blandensis]|nr:Putative defective protein IntQ [Thalassocella blandensis]
MGERLPTGVRVRDGKVQIWFTEKGKERRTYKTLDTTIYPNSKTGIIAAGKLRTEIKFKIAHDIYNPRDYWLEDEDINPVGTFSDWAQSWLDHPEHNWSSNTRRKYKGLLQKYWMPHFHAWDMIFIEYQDIIDALTAAQASKLSPSQYNDLLGTIRGVFGLYCKMKDIDDHKNPTRKLTNKKRVRDEADPFTIEEANSIIAYAGREYGSLWYGWFKLGFYTGLRCPGELLGLKHADIDQRSKQAVIRRQRIHSGEIQNHTKTRTARTINLNSFAMEALNAIEPHGNKFIFAFDATTPVRSNKIPVKIWKEAITALKIRYRPMYNMRHTFATYCLMNNLHAAYIARQLGHSQEEFFKTYATWINSQLDSLQIETLEKALSIIDSFKTEKN